MHLATTAQCSAAQAHAVVDRAARNTTQTVRRRQLGRARRRRLLMSRTRRRAPSLGRCPRGTAADAHAALVAAKEAQPAWAKTAPAARGEALKAMARVIRANRVELAELLASEQAKVAGLAQVEIDFTAEYFDYYAGWARIYEAGEIISF